MSTIIPISECPICNEETPSDQMLNMRCCRNELCTTCHSGWIARSSTCMYCRKRIVSSASERVLAVLQSMPVFFIAAQPPPRMNILYRVDFHVCLCAMTTFGLIAILIMINNHVITM